MRDERRTPYEVEVRENDRRVSIERIVDPFIHTTIHPRGWRNAVRLLFRRLTFTVIVSGDSEIVERILELDDDYLGPPGSESRRKWDEQLQGALHRFAQGASDA